MQVSRVLVGLGLCVTVMSSDVGAQPQAEPAEAPPADFAGRQFVDSGGCVFIRADLDGEVVWTPRVNRNREQVCGQVPSLQGTAVATIAPQPPGREPQAPEFVDGSGVSSAIDAPSEERMVILSRPADLNLPKIPSDDLPFVGGIADAPERPEPREIPLAVAATAPLDPEPIEPENTPTEVALVSAGTVVDVPATQPIATATPVRVPTAKAKKPSELRVLPKHLGISPSFVEPVPVPQGYAPVWEDDRLNTRRAEQTLSGHKAMQLVWTNTVPRRLIDEATGRDMTARLALIYPYTDTKTQRRELGKVTLEQRDGQLVKRIVRRAKQPLPQARDGVFVQVGTYGVASNATRAADRLKQTGLTPRFRRTTLGGKTVQVVLAGPFEDKAAASRAVRSVRSLGYSDAFIVK